jgi:acetyl-CoA C-acetyltransferase
MRDIILAGCVRTAIGNYNGVFKGTPATDLGAAAIRQTLVRTAVDPAAIGSVVMGNVIQAGNRMNPARQAAIGGGLPVSVPAQTVNRVCGSGAQAIISAADARPPTFVPWVRSAGDHLPQSSLDCAPRS